MMRSYSEPSIGTIGTVATTATSCVSHMNMATLSRLDKQRGKFFWEGKMRKYTMAIMLTPWNMWFQSFLLITIIYKYILHLLLAYYLDQSWFFLDLTVSLGELFFLADVIVHLLHVFWPIVRQHIRVLRRNHFFLVYDIISLVPLTIIFSDRTKYREVLLAGRWFGIGRIYRLFTFFQAINETIRKSRKALYMVEHVVFCMLVLHAGTCLWFALHRFPHAGKHWYKLGYPPHVNSWILKFDDYVSCWYYCACRFCNVIFGDVFPLRDLEKWLTAVLMLIGYVFFRYQFIGLLTWELVLENTRRSTFVDRIYITYYTTITHNDKRGLHKISQHDATIT